MKFLIILVYLIIFLVKMTGILFFKLGLNSLDEFMNCLEVKLELLCDWIQNV